jgi:hypothetical protein
MMRRRSLLLAFLFGLPELANAHSPWGQYQVYRKKHLLILSTREDIPSYPYSKKLVDTLNATVPTANARPARAIDLDRVYDLLRTDQFQFALLSNVNVDMMINASGRFAGRPKVDLRTVFRFGELRFVVRGDFPENLVAIVTHGIVEALPVFRDAVSLETLKADRNLHPGALMALQKEAGKG